MAVVDRDDGLVEWTGWIGRQLRPCTEDDARSMVRVILVMYVFALLPTVLIAAGWIRTVGVERSALLAQNVPASIVSIAYFVWILRRPRATFLRLLPATTMLAFFVAVIAISRGLVLVGPDFSAVVVFYIEAPLVSFYILRFKWAVPYTAFMMGCYALVLSRMEGLQSPFGHWLILLSTAVVSGVLMGGLAGRLQEARSQIAHFNTRLRRFLAPQVADALQVGDGALAPHKSAIAVFFVDLRGFTAFTNAQSAERVVEVLADYYDVVGSIVHRYRGTIGGFDGDGVFAFLGDPIPNENAAADALTMAKEIARALDAHTRTWGLGYGIGLAYGEATVGLVGFEGRLDYTPVGACVNLAARLCSDAKPGEIVIDDALREAAGVTDAQRRDDVDLKGFGPMPTYAVTH